MASKKTPAELDAEIAVELGSRISSRDSYESELAVAKKLKAAIRKRLRDGTPPCRAARQAIRELGLPMGVQGDDDEKHEDHFEVHYNDGRDTAAPVLAMNRSERGVWSV